MTSETCVQLSSEIAFALLIMRIVVFVHREIRMDWAIAADISSISA